MNLIKDIFASLGRMPVWVIIWMFVILVPANIATLLFLGEPYSLAIAALGIAGFASNLVLLFTEKGFGNILAIPHLIFWIPLVFLIAYVVYFSNAALPENYALFLHALFLINAFSIFFDIRDAWRWKQGARQTF